MGRRGHLGGSPALPGADRRAGPVALARECAEPGARRLDRGRGARARAPQPPGDADDVPLLVGQLGQPSRPGLSAPLDRGRDARRAARTRRRRRRACGAARHARDRVDARRTCTMPGSVHGASRSTTWLTSPMGRLWLLGWQWAVPLREHPGRAFARRDGHAAAARVGQTAGCRRRRATSGSSRRCASRAHRRSAAARRHPAARPRASGRARRRVAVVLDKALQLQPGQRYPTVAAMVRAIDRVVRQRTRAHAERREHGGVARDRPRCGCAGRSPTTTR